MHRLVFLLAFLTGCEQNYGLQWSEDLTPFIEAHTKLGGSYDLTSLRVTIEVPEVNNPAIVGLCEAWTDGRKLVRLQPEYWYEANYHERLALVHHELGHCIRGYEHRGNWDAEKRKFTSLMFPYTLPNGMYRSDMKRYDRELVTKEWYD